MSVLVNEVTEVKVDEPIVAEEMVEEIPEEAEVDVTAQRLVAVAGHFLCFSSRRNLELSFLVLFVPKHSFLFHSCSASSFR